MAAKNPNEAKKVAAIEAAYVRLRNRSSGMIGSAARRSMSRKSREQDEADEDQAADPEVGPVARRWRW